jgi:hypothetical protein
MLKTKMFFLARSLLKKDKPFLVTRMRSVVVFLMIVAGTPALATTYRWVDSKGKVHYGDVMPPQQSGLGHQELDRQGRVVREAPRTLLTPEERRRQADEAAARAEHMRRVEDQQRRDRALLSTYADETEIDLARDRALELEQLTLNGLRARMHSGAAKLAYANDQLARYRAARATEPANVAQMRDEALAELARIGAAIAQREKTMGELKQRFEADKERFQELMELKAMVRQ